MNIKLSDEQESLIKYALDGRNVLVDACIGSGKTTTIQQLCNRMPKNKKVLYLTYNKLLKIDAREKIRCSNCFVTNYHGFAYTCLASRKIRCGISDLIQTFNRVKPSVPMYDVLIIDEYQDIEQEFAEMLEHIRNSNPDMQIIMVGDMEQKIYDKTTLDADKFAKSFLSEYTTVNFTKCFRISKNHAAMLGRIWHKEINGVNPDCQISTMSEYEAVQFLAKCDPSEFLCLGARTGSMSRVLNNLERNYPKKFNKNTVYASISDTDNRVEPSKRTAIFTTFDSSKGLERKICVVFDFTSSYWNVRLGMPSSKYSILRNIFCVAASRGKEKIIFVEDGWSGSDGFLSERELSSGNEEEKAFNDMDISGMFDFKYIEDIERCYSLLDVRKKRKKDHTEIAIRRNDGLIDLSPCVGIFQEAEFFTNYDIAHDFDIFFTTHPDRTRYDAEYIKNKYPSLEQQILYLVSLETNQDRYITQVDVPFVNDNERDLLYERLSKVFRQRENIQVSCSLPFTDRSLGKAYIFNAVGRADVVKDDIVYELKFVSELQHTHFLQCAVYMVCLNLDKGILWNTRNNEMYEISVPDRKAFLDNVARTITKGRMKSYCL